MARLAIVLDRRRAIKPASRVLVLSRGRLRVPNEGYEGYQEKGELIVDSSV